MKGWTSLYLIFSLFHWASSLPPIERSPGIVIPEPTRQKSFGFLDNNGSNLAKLVETTSSDITDDSDQPQPLNEFQVSLKDSSSKGGTQNRHAKATILSIMLGIVFSPLLQLAQFNHQEQFWIRAIIFGLNLLECVLCSTRKYLSNSLSPSEWNEYVQQLMQAEPRIVWEMECYHYKHVWTKQDSHRSTDSREKVITHRTRQTFSVEQWRDLTSADTMDRAIAGNDNLLSESSRNDSHPFLKTTLAKLFVFHNPFVAERYWLEEAMFIEREKRRDLHYDFTRKIQIDNFRHKVLVVRTGLSDVQFASTLWFWIASILGLTVPYRVWFARHCKPVELTITKEVME